MNSSPADFLRVEAERYRSVMKRTANPELAARWARVADEYEELAVRAESAFGLIEVYSSAGRTYWMDASPKALPEG